MHFKTLGNLTSLLLLVAAIAGSAIAFAADSAEKLTGLPLHPGLTYPQEVNTTVCGKKASANLYDASPNATLQEFVAWYRQQLKNFH